MVGCPPNLQLATLTSGIPDLTSRPILPSCSGCGATLGDGDAFCRGCGRSTTYRMPWYHRRVPLMILMFGVIGPLALPMLWRSEAFTRPQKLVVSLLCAAQMVAVAFFVKAAYERAMDAALKQLGM